MNNTLPQPLNKATTNTDGYLGHDDFNNFNTPEVLGLVISLTSAQIKALNTTAIQLIPAPASNQFIQVLSVTGSLTYATAAYATETEIDIIDTTTGDVLFSDKATLLAATASTVAQILPTINSNTAPAITPGGSVSITSPTANPTAGAGTLKIYVLYKIVTL